MPQYSRFMTSYESMTSGRWTVFSNPLTSGGLLLACAVIAMVALRANEPAWPWRICGISMLFFAVYSQVMGLFLKRWPLYMGLSYLAFIAHTVLLLTIAGLLTDMPLADAPRFQKTFALLGVFFIMLSVLAGVYRVALYLLCSPKASGR